MLISDPPHDMKIGIYRILQKCRYGRFNDRTLWFDGEESCRRLGMVEVRILQRIFMSFIIN